MSVQFRSAPKKKYMLKAFCYFKIYKLTAEYYQNKFICLKKKKEKMIINLEIYKFLLISITLCLLSVNFNFILFSIYLDDIIGQIFTLLILTVAAAESSIGLAILVMYYRRKGIISINVMNYIKG
jgi:NADH-quinone oxidoreductase subunit K